MSQNPTAFWSVPSAEMLQRLQTTPQGLTSLEARQRLARFGANLLRPRRRLDVPAILLSQFSSPIIIILLVAAGLSFFLGGATDALIILTIVLASGLLGFWQEWKAASAVESLLAIVQIRATTIRDGNPAEVPVEMIVPGDVVILNAGDIVPGDCLILESQDLFVDEATLTGETFPAEKMPGVLPPELSLSRRVNSLFMGTHVVSGSAKVVVVLTGQQTEFGKVSKRLVLRPPETEFERGVRRFGYFLIEVTLLLVIAIFAINVYLARPVLEAFLFSLALAVGLTPQLLPAIISVNLATGAQRMAKRKVIVRRLASIENYGSMEVLCSDKTGTLTEGVVRVEAAHDIEGNESEKVLLYAYLNAFYETGFTNPIDEAIRTHRQFDVSSYQKVDEVPYDFVRRRLSILVSKDSARLIVMKGAVNNVLAICSSAETSVGTIVDIATAQEKILQHFDELSSEGFRILGVAYRSMAPDSLISRDDEIDMTFLGFLVLFDPPKPEIIDTLDHLKQFGVSLKIITGDNRLVTASLGRRVQLSNLEVITGSDLHKMSDEALLKRANEVDLFAEIEPNQKERIILLLRRSGKVVGFMGDGINDAPALHAADVGISVESAVDIAKETADIVLLEKDLGVLVQGAWEGRITFANTLKYVFMATSANFGNMFSMAGASVFLPFLPLLPKQVLLTNMLTDLPEMTIATDSVDKEMIEKPRRWDIVFIRKFMITFGLVSSVFDYVTFGVLLLILHSSTVQFRTGWFVESVISASMAVLVVRTRAPFFRSRPGKYLVMATFLVWGATLILPFTSLGELFGFDSLPVSFLLMLGIILTLYVIMAEAAKRVFYRVVKF